MPSFDDLRQRCPELFYLKLSQRIKSPADDFGITSLGLRNDLRTLECAFNKSLASIIGVWDTVDKPSQLKLVDQGNHRILMDAEATG